MSDRPKSRTEHDSMGDIEVPADALYGAQTQRAVQNFPVSALRFPRPFLRALGYIKAAAASANGELDELPAELSSAVVDAALEVANGSWDAHFPVDIFQTGSGTSTNMNANEVIAALAKQKSQMSVHPNDHVNRGQSSNDVIPTAIHVSALLETKERLLPALAHLEKTIRGRAAELSDVVTTGRTHLMDAMPITLGQELGGWAQQIRHGQERLENVLPRLARVAQGGTAVGTGINAHPDFAEHFARRLSGMTGHEFHPATDRFEALSSQDTTAELSAQLKVLALALTKIANDLRWMNSGPLTGLAEISLPALQPGSSIMPGKVNPVIPEAVAMVCAQVIGNDLTVSIGNQAGNFQLNVMLPVIAYNVLQSIELLSNACRLLADQAIAGFVVQQQRMEAQLDRNPILVTALNARIGYEQAAAIAKRAYAEGRPIREVAAEMTDLSEEELQRLLDPRALT